MRKQVSRLAVTAFLVGVLAVLPRGFATAACERVIVSADPEFPPFAWYDGQILRGASVDIAIQVLDRLRLPYEIRYVGPFPRVLQAARDGTIDLITELKNTPERMDYLAFPSTPIFVNPVAVFTRHDSNLVYRNWEDLIGRRGAITLANKFGGGFDEFLERELTIERPPRIELGFAMLAQQRIDYFVTSYYPGLGYMIDSGREAEFVARQPYVTASDNFIGLSRASPCIARLNDIDRVLAELVESGEVQRIVTVNYELQRRFPTRGVRD